MCESPVICDLALFKLQMGFVQYDKTNMPCQWGYHDGMSPLGRMVFPRAPPSGKPSSLGETFHHVTPTGMAYLYNVYISHEPDLFVCTCIILSLSLSYVS